MKRNKTGKEKLIERGGSAQEVYCEYCEGWSNIKGHEIVEVKTYKKGREYVTFRCGRCGEVSESSVV